MSQELTPLEQRVRSFLISRVKQHPGRLTGVKLEYQQLAKAIDPDQNYWSWPRFRGLGEVLGNISVYEHEHGRPLLSAIVVQAGTGHAGDGFYTGLLRKRLGIQLQPSEERAYWRQELAKVVGYWNGARDDEPDTQAKILALLTGIESQLAEVRSLIAAG